MRLAVSNLAWPTAQDAAAFARLAALGVAGVEVAPTRLAPWEALEAGMLAAWRARLADAGLAVSSLQAILFGRAEPQLLGDATAFAALAAHVARVSDIAAALGAGVMVFGSPRNRLRGTLAEDAAWALAQERLHHLAALAANAGVVLGIEPVPPIYGADFLTGWREVLRMVQQVDHPGVRVHLDTGCVALNGDAIAEAVAASAGWLAHFHAAQPQLGGFDPPAANHAEAAAALHAAGYAGWLAIEMREPAEAPLAAVETAVRAVRQIYA